MAASGAATGRAPRVAPPPPPPSATEVAIDDIRHLIGNRKFPDAKAKLSALSLPDTDGNRRVFEAAICLSENDFDAALAHALFAVNLRRGLWAAFTLAARVYIKFGLLDEAKEIISELKGEHEEKNEVEPAVRRQLIFFRQQGDEMLKWITELKQKQDALQQFLATGQKLTQATKLVDHLLTDCPASDEFQAARLEIYAALSMYDAMIAYGAKLSVLTRCDPKVRSLMATALLYKGDRDAARAEFEATSATELRSQRYCELFARMDQAIVDARMHLVKGRFAEVQSTCDAAMQLDPKVTAFTSDVKCILSQMHLSQGDVKSARRLAHEAVAVCATNKDAFVASASACYEMKNYEEAQRFATEALSLSPNDTAALRIIKKIDFHREMAKKTHYEVLGIPRTATVDQIRNAWRQRAKKHHPDRASDDDKSDSNMRMARYQEAYSVLTDACTRDQYDTALALQEEVDRFLRGLNGVVQGPSPPSKPPPPPPQPGRRRRPRRPPAAAAALLDRQEAALPPLPPPRGRRRCCARRQQ